jgi:hypothetical protein
MKISRANWTLSLDKYQTLVDGLELGKETNKLHHNFVATFCGYCREIDDKCLGYCDGCLFYSPRGRCAAQFGGCSNLNKHLIDNNRPEALKIAKNILQAIKDDEVNVYEEGE